MFDIVVQCEALYKKTKPKIDILFKQQHPPTGSQSETVVNENEPLKQTQVTENEFAGKNLRKFVFAM